MVQTLRGVHGGYLLGDFLFVRRVLELLSRRLAVHLQSDVFFTRHRARSPGVRGDDARGGIRRARPPTRVGVSSGRARERERSSGEILETLETRRDTRERVRGTESFIVWFRGLTARR